MMVALDSDRDSCVKLLTVSRTDARRPTRGSHDESFSEIHQGTEGQARVQLQPLKVRQRFSLRDSHTEKSRLKHDKAEMSGKRKTTMSTVLNERLKSKAGTRCESTPVSSNQLCFVA